MADNSIWVAFVIAAQSPQKTKSQPPDFTKDFASSFLNLDFIFDFISDVVSVKLWVQCTVAALGV